MSLAIREDFEECLACSKLIGTQKLCRECIERRSLLGVLKRLRSGDVEMPPRALELIRVCPYCTDGMANLECPEHGR